mmetsp:Transcript_10109/g.39477  ORF Transcript_10109/g.39477 Transcript_10109/m.39477 type:complete len:201 (-) Transcript_10109:542-1144(-)
MTRTHPSRVTTLATLAALTSSHPSSVGHHAALPEHVDHVEQRLPSLAVLAGAPLANLARQEQARVDGSLRVDAPPAHVMLKLERYGAVRRREPVRVKRVAQDVLLGDAHPVWNGSDLRRDVADQHGVFDVETASELVEGLDDGLRRATGVHLARLVRLRHRERVPPEGAGEVGRHELHRRLERDHLLAHLRRDDRGYPRR